MAITYVDTTATASQTDFLFNFDYLEDEHVVVTVDGVTQTLTTNYTIDLTSTKKIVLSNPTTPLAGGEIVRIQRISAPETDLVDFQNGSVLTEAELDRAYLHNRYLAEESAEQNDISLRVKAGADGSFDALNKKIVNVVDPTADQDAATKNYVDDTVAGVVGGTIPDGSITYAKIQNSVGNNVLLGNDNGADSDVQELTATEAKTLLGLSTVATSGSYNDLNDKPSTGTVVSIASGTGLTGGPITTSGTLGLASIANLRALGNVSGSSAAPTSVEIKDEDAMTSDSATALATQQSIKAYVDAQVVVSKWDSGWVNQDDQVAPEAVNAGATMVFDHTLGSTAMLPMFSVYAAEDASGTNMQSQLYEYWISSTGVSSARGIQVKSITSSQVTVQLADQGYKALSDGTFSSQAWGTTTNQFTHIRVVLIG